MSTHVRAYSLAAWLVAASLLSPWSDHIVERGDTLSQIAAAYDSSVKALVEANQIDNPDLIIVGEILRIPGADGTSVSSVVHVVQPGDTLSQIAAAYGTTITALVAANGIVDPNLIYVGTRLDVEGSSPSPTEAEAAPPAPAPSATTTYEVVAGDTVAIIAARLGVSISELVAVNGLSNPNLIRIGQRLTVPGGFVCPVTPSSYVDDFGYVRPGGRVHQGIDIFAGRWTEVRAPVGGTVEYQNGSIGGLQFWLRGDDGNLYIGTHLEAFGSATEVNAGEVIGYVGNSGNAAASSPHLHFEIVVDGSAVNPYPILKGQGC